MLLLLDSVMGLDVVDDCEETLNGMARDAELNRTPEREIWEQNFLLMKNPQRAVANSAALTNNEL